MRYPAGPFQPSRTREATPVSLLVTDAKWRPFTVFARTTAGFGFYGFPWLFKECLDAGQHIVNHHLRSRLDTLGATGLKINGANLVTQNNPLRFGA